MANTSVLLTTCKERNLRKKNPSVKLESHIFLASDLKRQGINEKEKVWKWADIKDSQIGGQPVQWIPPSTVGSPINFGQDYIEFTKGTQLQKAASPILLAESGELYIRFQHSVRDASFPQGSSGVLYRMVLPDTPYEQLKVEYIRPAAGTTHYKVSWYDAGSTLHEAIIDVAPVKDSVQKLHDLKLLFAKTLPPQAFLNGKLVDIGNSASRGLFKAAAGTAFLASNGVNSDNDLPLYLRRVGYGNVADAETR